MTFYFFHGMGGSSEDWRRVCANLPGTSLELPSKVPLAALIPALAEKIPASGAILCGYSMGGRIALLLAEELLQQGKRPGGLALLGAGMGFVSPAEREARLRSDEIWASLAAGSPEKFWLDWYQQELFASFRDLPPHKQESWLSSRKSMDSSNLIWQLLQLGPGNHPSLIPILRQLHEKDISVLYLVGELDKKYLDLGHLLTEQGLVALKTIRGAGHILPLEAPEEVAGHLMRFFAE